MLEGDLITKNMKTTSLHDDQYFLVNLDFRYLHLWVNLILRDHAMLHDNLQVDPAQNHITKLEFFEKCYFTFVKFEIENLGRKMCFKFMLLQSVF